MNTKIADLSSELKGLKSQLKDLFPDDLLARVLDSVGLEQRRSPVRGMISGTGLFLAGVIVGGAAALLLAPKSGIEMRSNLEDKLDQLIEKVKHLRGTKEEAEDESISAKAAKDKSDKGEAKKETRTPAAGTPPSSGPGGSFHS